jgi:type 1 glutamine amidotransferase
MLFTIRYGKGQMFHNALGHTTKELRSVDFVVTLQRGAEWAASGKVTQKVPDDFPTADKASVRP